MPVMHVFDDAGWLRPDAGTMIWATMLVPEGPRNPNWQLHVDAQLVDEALTLDADGLRLDRAAFNRLYNAGKQFVENDRQQRHRDGQHVGEILLLMKTVDREQPEQASLGKAIRMHAGDMAPFRGQRLLRTESKLRAAWHAYEAAAPLWAANRLLCRSRDYGVGASVDWRLLLALAERYRCWAEKHRSPLGRTGTGRAAEPLLANGVAWSVPDHALLLHAEALQLDRLVPGRGFQRMIRNTPAPSKKLSTT
jgi:hypothetical protein